MNAYLITPKAELEARIYKLQNSLLSNDIEGILINNEVLEKPDLFYFCGTTQQAYLYIPGGGKPILMIKKSYERACRDSSLKNKVLLKNIEQIPHILDEYGYSSSPKTLGIQIQKITAGLYLKYLKIFSNSKIINVQHFIRMVRLKKSAYEIGIIRRAARISDTVFARVNELLKEGMTEVELAGKLESVARREGHQGILRMDNATQENFYGQLMSGPNAAIPTFFNGPTGGQGLNPAMPQSAGFRKIRRCEPILIDFVGSYNGYVADQTRVASIGILPHKFVNAYKATLEIQNELRSKIKPNVYCSELYEVATKMAHKLGYEAGFMGIGKSRVNFVGHGIGVVMDELPILSPSRRFNLPLEAGMVIAIEPKIVFNDGVVGLEDSFVINHNGAEQLTNASKEIIAPKAENGRR